MNNQPTVGTILHYYTPKSGPEAAIVTGIRERVNIHVFGHGRPGFDRESVWLCEVGGTAPDGETSWCQWPPREEVTTSEWDELRKVLVEEYEVWASKDGDAPPDEGSPAKGQARFWNKVGKAFDLPPREETPAVEEVRE